MARAASEMNCLSSPAVSCVFQVEIELQKGTGVDFASATNSVRGLRCTLSASAPLSYGDDNSYLTGETDRWEAHFTFRKWDTNPK